MELKRQRDQLSAKIEDRQPSKPQPSARAIASQVWQLDRILTSAPATTVRHVLKQLIDTIRLDFEPAGRDGRGKRYKFAGGVIRLLAQELQPVTAL
jgi:hypothetical protein